jgi:hypothetical protein
MSEPNIPSVPEQCAICFENINPTQNIHITDCKHIFHGHCFVKWAITQHDNKTTLNCPKCRQITIPKQHADRFVELAFDEFEDVRELLPFHHRGPIYIDTHNQTDIIIYKKTSTEVFVPHTKFNTMIQFFKQLFVYDNDSSSFEDKCIEYVSDILHFVESNEGLHNDHVTTYEFDGDMDINELVQPTLFLQIKDKNLCRVMYEYDTDTWKFVELTISIHPIMTVSRPYTMTDID